MAKALLLNTRSLFAPVAQKGGAAVAAAATATAPVKMHKKMALKKPAVAKPKATATTVRRKAAAPTDALTLYRTEIPTPLGDFCVYSDESGAVRACNWTDGEAALLAELRSQWYPRTALGVVDPRTGPVNPSEETVLRHCAAKAEGLRCFFAADSATVSPAELQRYLAGVPVCFPPQSAAYTRQVWETLMREVPAGKATTYGSLSDLVNAAAPAPRAVGRAMATNPICVLMPCHRVLGSNGATRGYGAGLYRKVWLLRHERAPAAEVKLRAVENVTEVHNRTSFL